MDPDVSTLILGLGNDILRDDRVGLLAARELAKDSALRADIEEACLCNLDLLPILDGYDRAVVLDAIWGEAWEAGQVYRYAPSELPHTFGYRSPHTIDFPEMLEIGRQMGFHMPADVLILTLGVEDPFSFGEELSPSVEEGLPKLVAAAVAAVGG
ncbi:MAG: hydrogenase maturation protease [Armatimonadia bacterium]|nr:hydrogenase maturation protease [Armatimonadia bacterium]